MCGGTVVFKKVGRRRPPGEGDTCAKTFGMRSEGFIPHFKCSFTPDIGQLRIYISFVAGSPTGQQLTSIVLALNV